MAQNCRNTNVVEFTNTDSNCTVTILNPPVRRQQVVSEMLQKQLTVVLGVWNATF